MSELKVGDTVVITTINVYDSKDTEQYIGTKAKVFKIFSYKLVRAGKEDWEAYTYTKSTLLKCVPNCKECQHRFRCMTMGVKMGV